MHWYILAIKICVLDDILFFGKRTHDESFSVWAAGRTMVETRVLVMDDKDSVILPILYETEWII